MAWPRISAGQADPRPLYTASPDGGSLVVRAKSERMRKRLRTVQTGHCHLPARWLYFAVQPIWRGRDAGSKRAKRAVLSEPTASLFGSSQDRFGCRRLRLLFDKYGSLQGIRGRRVWLVDRVLSLGCICFEGVFWSFGWIILSEAMGYARLSDGALVKTGDPVGLSDLRST